MLYLIIPLLLALAALVAVAILVWRKMPYLRKLTPEAHETGETLLHDFAPEAVDWAQNIPWRRSLHNAFVEIERILHRGRTLMASVDRASDKVIKKVRHVHQEAAKQEERIEAQRQEEEAAKEREEEDEIDMSDLEQLKQEEQRLIVAIAQSPKDIKLYSRLAQVYMQLKNYTDAVEALQAALKIDPDAEGIRKRLERARQRLIS